MPRIPERLKRLFSQAVVICRECGQRVSISDYFYHKDTTGIWWEGWYVCETPWCYEENFCNVSVSSDALPSRKIFPATR